MQELETLFSIHCANDSQQLVAQCDVVVLAVKPQVLQAVLEPLAEAFRTRQPLVISIVAGIRSDTMERWLGGDFSLVRVMPNTPALVGLGASGMVANARVSKHQKALTLDLMNSIGISRWVEDEQSIDLVTALSGSGPAYFMLFMQSLIDAAVAAGLDPQTARDLTMQTAVGAAELIRHSDRQIQTLIENVTSPGGTTEQALKSFADSDLASIVADAFSAARRRAEQMSVEFDT